MKNKLFIYYCYEKETDQKMNEENDQLFPEEVIAPAPRKRGRPRKNPLPESVENTAPAVDAPAEKTPAKRGRKPKAAAVEVVAEVQDKAPVMPEVPAAPAAPAVPEMPEVPAAPAESPRQDNQYNNNSTNNVPQFQPGEHRASGNDRRFNKKNRRNNNRSD